MSLLEAALKKLNHDAMDLSAIEPKDHRKARNLAVDIQDRANAIESEIYRFDKTK